MRYYLHQDDDGDYSILDMRTFEVVTRSGVTLDRLHLEAAKTLLSLLEELDRRRELPN